MKRVILLTVLVLLISSGYLFSDVPCKINYQGRLIENNVPVSGPKTMVFSIYDSLGTELWTSGEKPIQVHNGLFRHVLGEGFIGGSPVADLSSIDWTAGEVLYLEVTVGGETLSPREPIYAYPYAINSHLFEGSTKEYFINVSGEGQTKYGPLNIMGNVGIGTTDPGAKLDVNGKIKEYGNDLLPRGVIVMWSGTLATIPGGWALCDGGTYPAPDGAQVTTPDLRDKFIYGVTAGENPGATGGSDTHQHTVGIYRSGTFSQGIAIDWSWPYWTSGTPSGNQRYYGYAGPYSRNRVMQTSPTSTLPPYYKLAFIMKL